MTKKGVEQKGNHEPLISEATFYKCQKLLRSSGDKAYLPESKKSEDFPLRHFAICGHCGRPLTASYSRGKSGKRFPYYRCYNWECPSKKSIAKKKIEEEFIDYLREITPEEKYLKYIQPIIIDVWNTKYKELNQEKEALEKELEGLNEEKTELIAMKRKNLIPDEDFVEEFDNIKIRIADVKEKMEEVKIENFDMKEATDFVFGFISQMANLWEKKDFESKLKIQSLIFPQKVIYQNNRFETPQLSLLFAQKRELSSSLSPKVPPRRIELLFSG